jgi:O-antigen ligase
LDPWLRWPLLLLPCYVAFQLIPLPLSLLRFLSPARAEVLNTLAPVDLSISFAPVSVIASATLPQLLSVAGYIAVFLLVREIAWCRSDRPWMPVFPIIIIGGLEAALGLLQYALSETAGPAHGTYVNRNHFAGLLEMTLPFAVIYPVAMLRRRRSRRHFSAPLVLKACTVLAAALLIFMGIAYSLSRMGFAASLCSIFAMGVLGLGAGRPARKRWLAIGLMGALVLLSFIFLAPDQLILRFAHLSSSDGRVLMWKETLPLIAAYPLFGCGLGGYESAFHKFNVSSPNWTVDYAHNDYLQLMAELGILGFLIAAALMLAILVKALRATRRNFGSDDHYLSLACTSAIIVILIHSFVDFNLYIPANALLLAWISGIAVRVQERAELPRRAGHEEKRVQVNLDDSRTLAYETLTG